MLALHVKGPQFDSRQGRNVKGEEKFLPCRASNRGPLTCEANTLPHRYKACLYHKAVQVCYIHIACDICIVSVGIFASSKLSVLDVLYCFVTAREFNAGIL